MTKKPEHTLVGVTGGIGSGKSTVCRILAGFGRTIISADEIARSITNTNADVLKKLRLEFGPGIILPKGVLDRQKLASLVFADPQKLAFLNHLVHPYVFEEIRGIVKALGPPTSKGYVVIEAALVFESRMDDWLDYTIAIHAPEETRIRRVIARDNSTMDDTNARIRSQMPDDKLLALADFAIENDSDELTLRNRVAFVDRILLSLPDERT